MTYSAAFMEEHSVVLLGERPGSVTVGVATEPSADLRRTLQSHHCCPVVFRRMSANELLVARQRAAGETRVNSAGRSPAFGVGISSMLDSAPAVNVVNSILNEAASQGASDIHIEAHHDLVRVRYRVDGVLRPVDAALDATTFAAVSARLKVLAGLNAAERRRPQDGRFTVRLSDDSIDIRFSALPTIGGESLVLRLFPAARRALDIDELGMPAAVADELATFVERGAGFMLIAGPTGSGKTTTLHALLRRIARNGRKVVTIEDPVEYRLEGAEQVQTNEAAGLTFDSLLRRVLRQDPDVIMVGEIRDGATAGLSVRAVLTGHLVLATVHAGTADSVGERLASLNVEPALLRIVDPVVVAQRLVRTICDACNGSGCSRCFGTGLRGRTGLFELGHGTQQCRTFASDAREKLAAGRTRAEEVAWAIEA
ncbi:MAG: GspE/PulE family protein [Spirochaetota bacterium]